MSVHYLNSLQGDTGCYAWNVYSISVLCIITIILIIILILIVIIIIKAS